MIAFIQGCSLYALDQGGSTRIFRSLLDTDHPPVLSVSTSFSTKSAPAASNEVRVPTRPYFGRLDRTRLHPGLGVFDGLFRMRFEARLLHLLIEHHVKLIHLLVADYSVVSVRTVASQLRIPYFITIHDYLEYVSRGHPFLKQMVASVAEAWRGAREVFVISEELGQDYSQRFGAREYRIITDGLKSVAEAPIRRPPKSLRIYFMGLFHLAYGPNLRALLDALKIVRSKRPDWDISITCRCGAISVPIQEDDVHANILPFASQREVEKDMLSADLLYQPLPFQEYALPMCKFSMSTKMVTYIGSGLPILYHGPNNAAACRLLVRHKAAVVCTTLDPVAIAKQLLDTGQRRESIAGNALALARSQFMLNEQQGRFWPPIIKALQQE